MALMSGEQRQSNPPVENWFGLVKNNILSAQYSLMPTKFVRKVRANILELHRDVKLKKNRK